MTELERCEVAKSKGCTYNPTSGELKGIRGNVIKNKHTQGYIQFRLCVDDKRYYLYAHRLAWYLHYGKLPVNNIDHIDGNTSNNIISNLRDVTKQQNNFNNTKAKGYRWDKNGKKFRAQIKLNGKRIHLGMFNTEQEARNAYLAAKEKYHAIPSL